MDRLAEAYYCDPVRSRSLQDELVFRVVVGTRQGSRRVYRLSPRALRRVAAWSEGLAAAVSMEEE